MSDQPPGAARSLYPGLASAAPAQKPDTPVTELQWIAEELYGDGKKIARPVNGVSPLGGEARPAAVVAAETKARAAAKPKPQIWADRYVRRLQRARGW